MFTRVFDRGPAKRKLIAWGLGFAALAGLGLLSTSASIAANQACVASNSDWYKGARFDTFSTVGTCDWTVPAGVSTLDADIIAGGGGGGLSQFVGGGGGGGGQLVRLRSASVSAGALQPLTVGAGGAPVTMTDVSVGATGANGAASSFLNYSAAGGLGGKPGPVGTSTTGGAGGASYTDSTINAGVGTVSTVLRAGSVAVAGNSTCTIGRNGGGGASTFAAGLQTGGTALTSSVGANSIATNTLFGYSWSGGGGGFRDPVGSATTTAAPGGTGGGGVGGLGTLSVGIGPTMAGHGENGTGGGGGARGYEGNSSGFINTRDSSSFEDMTREMDRRICKVIDTIIEEDMPLHEKVAIHVEYGMAGASVWKFARLDMVLVLAEANGALADATGSDPTAATYQTLGVNLGGIATNTDALKLAVFGLNSPIKVRKLAYGAA